MSLSPSLDSMLGVKPIGKTQTQKPKQKPGTRVAQSVKRLTLDFSAGYDPKVPGIEPRVGLCPSREQSLLGILSPSLSLPLPHLYKLCLSWFWLRSWSHSFMSLNPASGSTLALWSLLGILSLSLSLCSFPTCAVSVSLKINK